MSHKSTSSFLIYDFDKIAVFFTYIFIKNLFMRLSFDRFLTNFRTNNLLRQPLIFYLFEALAL